MYQLQNVSAAINSENLKKLSFSPDMLGPFTFCMTKKMRQPEKVYIGSVFIIHLKNSLPRGL
jgi:hypothetical protein